MNVRIVRRGDTEFEVMVEQESKKGKKVTTGKTVTLEGLAAEVGRLVKEIRGEA